MKNNILKEKKKVIFLMGPTASNKTNLAIELYKRFPIEIINVDSVKMYRKMNIGTAKPSFETLLKTPHRLIDIYDPTDSFSVVDFCHRANQEIKKIIEINRIPLLVGGSMFYFKTLLEGLSVVPQSNKDIRYKIQINAKRIGWDKIYKILKKVDPVSAYRIHPNDLQRISRALEIFLISNKTMTEKINTPKKKLNYLVYQFATIPNERIELYENIKKRFYTMLENGFENEVNSLAVNFNLNKNTQSMKSIGYRQMWSYLSNEINYQKMILLSIKATKNLAKRQITWLKKFNNVCWLNSNNLLDSVDKIACLIEKKN